MELIDGSEPSTYHQVFRTEKKKQVLVAEGFEVSEQIEVKPGERIDKWKERRLFVHSIKYAKSQQHALDKRLIKAEAKILQLTERKQGKPVLKTKKEYNLAITAILQANKVEGLITVELKKRTIQKEKRAYGDKPKRIEKKVDFSLTVCRQTEEIRQRKKYMGWQIYATNAPSNLLTFEQCVWKYRYQSNIESRFDDIRNKMAALLPVFLQKDERIEGLVNVLLLALKVCSILEYKAAKSLQDQEELLFNVYEGNPNRGTDRPSAKRLLKAFDGVAISLIFEDNNFQFALMTKLKPVQKKVLEILDLKEDIYTGLIEKIELWFSNKKVIDI